MIIQHFVIFLFGLSLGSGVALKRAGPYIFFYIATPLLSAIATVALLEHIDIPGINFQFDKFIPMVLANQSALIVVLGKGLALGLVLQWLIKTLFLKTNRRAAAEMAIIDGNTPMSRRKYLAILGLEASAGPRDILVAWSNLTSEATIADWRRLPRRRKTDIAPEERVRQVNEAYQWLVENPKKNGLTQPTMMSNSAG